MLHKLKYISSIVVLLLLFAVTLQVYSDIQFERFDQEKTELADLDTEEESEDEVEDMDILLYGQKPIESTVLFEADRGVFIFNRSTQQPSFEVASPPPELK